MKMRAAWWSTLMLAPTLALAQEITIPKGTVVDLVLEDALSSRTAKIGDVFHARLPRALYVDRALALPAGTVVEGRVEAVKSLREGARSGFVGLEFVRILLPGNVIRTRINAKLTGMRQDDREQLWKHDPPPRLDAVLVGRSVKPGGRARTLVGDDVADAYSKTRLTEADVDIAAGTLVSMEFEEPLRLPPAVASASAR